MLLSICKLLNLYSCSRLVLLSDFGRFFDRLRVYFICGKSHFLLSVFQIFLRKGFWGVMLLMSLSVTTAAEDIDLFVGAPPTNPSDVPNVLIILDNTANWNTAFANEINALSTVFSGLDVDKFRVGLMMFTETGAGNANPDGAYVRAAIRLMDSTNKTKYQSLINSLHILNDKSNGGKLGLTMAEAYYYFAGINAYAGHNKAKRDYLGSTYGTTQSKAIYALDGNAFSSSSDVSYESPVNSGCQKNFIIYISNGPVMDNSSDTSTANTKLTAAGGSTTQISISPSGSQSNAGDEWARFMASSNYPQIITYTIDVNPGTTGQGPGFTALLKSMAGQGKGKYFAVDSSVNSGQQITVALKQIFSEIQAKDSVFASASLPVSVNTQGTYLNQIFVGMFRPDATASPRWTGNLKQYQFKASLTNNKIELKLADADGALAINNSNGFITQCARSFWTPSTSTPDTYWSFSPQGGCLAIVNSQQSNTPDGEVVEKGAAAYKLRAIDPATRVVKTCDATSCTGLTSFDNANTAITQSLLGVTSSSERTNLINWVRGQDTKDENINGNATEIRPSAHGDIVHSRPVAVDYGGSIGVVVFYGASDGMFHAINGNQSSNIGAFTPGSELWSFVAPEHFGRLKRIYDNSPAITIPSIGDATVKPYFFDGRITAYKDSSTVWVYATQRRGGRMVYAFDASTPTNPSLKWHQGCPNLTNDTGCTSASFNSIGQTWSAAISLKSTGYTSGSTPLPMLIFGGGYDTCEDGSGASDLNICTAPKGNKIFVLDANDGTLLKTFSTDRSVVGDVTVVPNSITGLAEYAYAADTGGNVYRITIGSAAPASWTIMKIASLGCDTTDCPGGVANRKFLFAPEVVVAPDYNIILIGSGDREHPLLSHTTTISVDNAFFMVKDKPTNATWWSTETGNCQSQALACKASLLAIDPDSTVLPTDEQLNAKKGWYMPFGTGVHDKEQVVTSAVAVLGIVTFSTHTPTVPDSCGTNLGEARVYNLGFMDGKPAVGSSRYVPVTGGGLPPSPVAGMVAVVNPSTGENITVPFIIGADPNSPLEAGSPKAMATTTNFKTRAYWYLQQ